MEFWEFKRVRKMGEWEATISSCEKSITLTARCGGSDARNIPHRYRLCGFLLLILRWGEAQVWFGALTLKKGVNFDPFNQPPAPPHPFSYPLCFQWVKNKYSPLASICKFQEGLKEELKVSRHVFPKLSWHRKQMIQNMAEKAQPIFVSRSGRYGSGLTRHLLPATFLSASLHSPGWKVTIPLSSVPSSHRLVTSLWPKQYVSKSLQRRASLPE